MEELKYIVTSLIRDTPNWESRGFDSFDTRTMSVLCRSLPLRVIAVRKTLYHASQSIPILSSPFTSSLPLTNFSRHYAVKTKSKKSTATLVPGSQQKLTDEAAIEEFEKAEKKMQVAVEWYRKEVASLETRASGRVTPALLSSVRVALPDSHGELYRLEDLATVGVRDGSTLLVTMFEEHVCNAIYVFFCPADCYLALVVH